MNRVSLFIFFILLTSLTFSEVPRDMKYQGKLTNSAGVALSGDWTIVFKLYDAETEGILVSSEEKTVTITNGLFDVTLDFTTPPRDTLKFGRPYWIELTVNGETLSPREGFSPVAYAYHSIYSDTAAYYIGGGASNGWVDDGVVVRLETASDKVGIGTAIPTEQLEITKNFRLPATTGANIGVVYSGASRFIHNYGTENTFLGANAGNFTMTNRGNTGIGYSALQGNTIGFNNVAVGDNALYTNGTDAVNWWESSNNTAVGSYAGYSNTTGSHNTAIGSEALRLITTGGDNTAVGSNALRNATESGGNVAVGKDALNNTTTGSGLNTACGVSALRANTDGYWNTAVGANALLNATANFNTAVGADALVTTTTGGDNTALGFRALKANTTGASNTAVGSSALYQNTGARNTSVGNGTLGGNISGNNNIALGYDAGNNITTGSNNLIIGYDIDAPSATASNQMSIGNLIFATGVNGTGTTISTGNVGIGTASPGAKLEVNGAVKANTLANVSSPIITGNLCLQAASGTAIYAFPTTTNRTDFFGIQDASGSSVLSVDTQNKRVGIGTTSPGAALEVAGQVKITGGSPGVGKVLTSDASGLASWQTPSGGGSSVPQGGIIMYSGTWNFDGTGLGTGTLVGWALCNGNNGTPNLSDKFVMGTTSSGGLGGTGGENSYSLTVSQLPSHNHSVSISNAGSHSHTGSTSNDGNHTHSGSTSTDGSHNHSGSSTSTSGSHTHSISDPGHSHSVATLLSSTWFTATFTTYTPYFCIPSGGHGMGTTQSATTGISINSGGSHSHTLSISSDGSHSHSLSINSSGSHSHTISTSTNGDHNHSASCSNTGSGSSIDNRPSFIALAYIMKL